MEERTGSSDACYTKRVHLNEGGAPVSTGAFDFGKEQAERVYRLVNSVEN